MFKIVPSFGTFFRILYDFVIFFEYLFDNSHFFNIYRVKISVSSNKGGAADAG